MAAHGYKYEILIKDSYKDLELDEKTIKDIGEKAKKSKSLRELRLLVMPWYAKQLDIVEFKEKRFEFFIEELGEESLDLPPIDKYSLFASIFNNS